MTDLLDLDATDQAAAVRAKEVSPSELLEAALDRIDERNGAVNAVIHRLDEKARHTAAGPLPDGAFRGVPMVLKDLTAHSAGDPFHEGTRYLRDLGWTEAEDTFLVSKFRAAGFVFAGRTNVPEFGLVPSTEPLAYGPTHNPWDLSRTAGGSSGGSAAAVAAGMVAVGHANDGGGSIRVPASVCGLYGLKPTRGRVSIGPEYGEVWAGFEAEHVVTRSVRDSAAILDAIAGPMPGDPYTAVPPARPYAAEAAAEPRRMRIGVLVDDPVGLVQVDAQCVRAARATADLLSDLGHEVVESSPAGLADPGLTPSFVTVYAGYAEWCLHDTARRTGRMPGEASLEAHTWALAEMSRQSSPGAYISALQYLHAYGRQVCRWWDVDGFDLLLTPTIPELVPVLGQFVSDPDNPLAPIFRAAAVVPFTFPFNVTGQPAASLPLHWSEEGLPLGVQIVGAYGHEDDVVSVSAQLERARPWAQRRPVL